MAIIKKGDNCATLAKRLNSTIPELSNTNNRMYIKYSFTIINIWSCN